ncbi:NAD(P)/FAD-dependent oxidoreductase [Mycobacterium vicinigordonae]|uniref:NAD(P)/FAD-dependent oxidoreductase n=1 Tax=Mycobacterium vicinigordonae TaxID=1719132 RepID=UPI0031B5B989
MSPQARAALAQRIKAQLTDTADAPDTTEVFAPAPDCEVAVIGGGIAALTLAMELHIARPATRVLIIEPVGHPVPEITHTVGESTVEVSAQYLRDRLGLADHLQASQLRKMGLRMFFSHDANADITQRMELGNSRYTPQVTFQIDRGRLENELTRRCLAGGVEMVTGRVRSVEFGDAGGYHTVCYQSGDTTNTRTTARWVVDASGRNRVLARQLGLKRTTEHHCNAVWLRVATEIDIGRWSNDPSWQERLTEGDRAMSTNHLMGEGYWVWLIRLASGSTSVGIVADPALHAFDSYNTLAKAQAWLHEHEPQCAAVLAEHDHLIKDFRVMKHYSHSSTKVYDGQQRWCLTGDSGIFLDPLYSSGLDLIAIGNGLITDMITRELSGENIVARASINDSLFRSLTDMWLNIYCNQYPLMGSPTVMSAKVIWDIAFYWGFLGLFYTNDRFADVADDPSVVPHLQRMIDLSNRMQQFFREWGAVEIDCIAGQFVDLFSPLNFMVALHTAMIGSSPEFDRQFDTNDRTLRQIAGYLVEIVVGKESNRFSEDNVMRQVQAWQRDKFLRELRSIYRHDQATSPISEGWILRSGSTPLVSAPTR